ncbi:lipase family alpha/beta hydrolase [Veronia pacifica]|uniref:Lipase n=1 Tax=Veronia pacifica TaxID=1080227 RepID=A0A1C3EPJ0_9GAMM|nr:triacylglycerol lipase [Veronia pacifica]ODA35157.1 lipase [Veronia pacifica]
MKRLLLLFATLFLTTTLYAQTSINNVSAQGYTKTKYPIVLVHGFLGFDRITVIDYFFNIPQSLTKGGADVYVVRLSAVNSSEARGEQLLSEVKEILALSGAEKVNLIGHSQGSPTSRYVASVRPDLVASVTSVGGANRGSEFADFLRSLGESGSTTEFLLSLPVTLAGNLISILSGKEHRPQDALGALGSLTTAGAEDFNKKYPQGMPKGCEDQSPKATNGVYYFSWSGTKKVTNALDASDIVLFSTGIITGDENDGLIRRCSSRLGKVIKDDYEMNHLDQINHTFGLHSLLETDPVTIYRQHANRLKGFGL